MDKGCAKTHVELTDDARPEKGGYIRHQQGCVGGNCTFVFAIVLYAAGGHDGRDSPCIISLSNLDRCRRRRRGAETRQRRGGRARGGRWQNERERGRERRGVLVCRPRPSNRQSVERASEGPDRRKPPWPRWPAPPLLLQSAQAASEAACYGGRRSLLFAAPSFLPFGLCQISQFSSVLKRARAGQAPKTNTAGRGRTRRPAFPEQFMCERASTHRFSY